MNFAIFEGRDMIRAENLCKYYSGNIAIENISFEINQGEIVGLLGLNGAGKSTILKILGCFLSPSSGQADLGGYSINDHPDEIRRLIGYLPDTPPLYNEMTVLNYISYVAKLKDVPADKVKTFVDEAIEKTSLGDVQENLLGSLSHGFRQRVGIAQAIVHKPKLLILDEPINGLDPIQIVEMRDLINALKGAHTVILSSHILSEITRTCDRIMIVDRGRLVAQGSEAELTERLSKQSRLVCEVAREEGGLVEKVRQISGVTRVDLSPLGQGLRLTVEAVQDIRSEVASIAVASGSGLLELRRDQGGLEQVFVKLVQSSERPQRAGQGE